MATSRDMGMMRRELFESQLVQLEKNVAEDISTIGNKISDSCRTLTNMMIRLSHGPMNVRISYLDTQPYCNHGEIGMDCCIPILSYCDVSRLDSVRDIIATAWDPVMAPAGLIPAPDPWSAPKERWVAPRVRFIRERTDSGGREITRDYDEVLHRYYIVAPNSENGKAFAHNAFYSRLYDSWDY